MYIKIRDDPLTNPLTYAVITVWFVLAFTINNPLALFFIYFLHLLLAIAVNVETFKLFGGEPEDYTQ